MIRINVKSINNKSIKLYKREELSITTQLNNKFIKENGINNTHNINKNLDQFYHNNCFKKENKNRKLLFKLKQ